MMSPTVYIQLTSFFIFKGFKDQVQGIVFYISFSHLSFRTSIDEFQKLLPLPFFFCYIAILGYYIIHLPFS